LDGNTKPKDPIKPLEKAYVKPEKTPTNVNMTRLWAIGSNTGLANPERTTQILPKEVPQTTGQGKRPDTAMSEEQKETLDWRKLRGDFQGIGPEGKVPSDSQYPTGISEVPGMSRELNDL